VIIYEQRDIICYAQEIKYAVAALYAEISYGEPGFCKGEKPVVEKTGEGFQGRDFFLTQMPIGKKGS
jgi:hypothetical protein